MNRIPEAQDVARLIKPTYEETHAALEEHYGKSDLFWSYQPVRGASHKIYSGELSVAAIEQMFRPPLDAKLNSAKVIGARCNRDVALLVREHAQRRTFQCHALQKRRVHMSAEHFLTVNPGFYFVENGVVKVFWLQPRKTYALTLHQMGILNGLLGLSHFRDDFEEADLELLDFSAADDGVRRKAVYNRADLPSISPDDLSAGLENFLRAYLALKDLDLKPARGERKVPIGPQLSLDF